MPLEWYSLVHMARPNFEGGGNPQCTPSLYATLVYCTWVSAVCTHVIVFPAQQTPLHLAARQGCGKSIELLLESGANYLLENDRKQTALRLVTHDTCRMSFENAIAKLEVPKRSRGEEDVVKGGYKGQV